MLQVDICFSFSVYKFAKGFSREGGREGERETRSSPKQHIYEVLGRGAEQRPVECLMP